MKFLFMLAPLEDVTDSAFRELCFRHGADMTFTMMTRLSGLVKQNKSTQKKIEILNDGPTQIQLVASKEDDLKLFLKHFKPVKNFAGINFNLGCPSPNFLRQGLGCVMIKRVSKVNRMVGIVKDYNYPCSVKMRLGLNFFEKQKKVYLNLINGVDADFFVVHARHGSEHYETKPDYSVYPECISTGKSIIANGDIDSPEKVRLLKEMGVKGVMIGRAAVRNPGIFERLKGLKETDIETLRGEYIKLADKYSEMNSKCMNNVLKRLGEQRLIEKEDNVRG